MTHSIGNRGLTIDPGIPFTDQLVKIYIKAPEMYEALKEIKKVSKRLNLWVGIDNIIDPILKDLES